MSDEDQLRALYDELVESNTRFRTMADSAPVLLWMSGPDSLCEFFNQQWLAFTGRPMEAELGTGWAEGVHSEDFQACMDIYLSAFVARTPFRMEYRLRRADGQYRWLLDHGVPRYSPSGAFAGYIGSCIDVTEMKEANLAQLRVARELEVLVKEIHHRVKNNLQVITSLLNLQMRHLGDGKAVQLFRETKDRIRSIALLHERLYRSRDLANILIDEYLGSIVGGLKSSFGATAPTIETVVEAKGVTLPIDSAIPCGLILNELVTNAFKYAFVQDTGRPPRIAVRVAPQAGGFDLVVEDNGVGMPEDVELASPGTLGLELVRTLTRQIGAEMSMSTQGGVRWTLHIPHPKDKEPERAS